MSYKGASTCIREAMYMILFYTFTPNTCMLQPRELLPSRYLIRVNVMFFFDRRRGVERLRTLMAELSSGEPS